MVQLNITLIAQDSLFYGIVTASKLSCRSEPNRTSAVLKYYDFGTPLKLVAKSDTKVVIDNVTDYWFKVENSGWVFGGFLLKTESDSLYELKCERIWNSVCGGLSCAYNFEAYLVGNYYISWVFLDDYPQNYNDSIQGVIIGKYSYNNGISFENPLMMGLYNGAPLWKGIIYKTSVIAKNYTWFTDFKKNLIKLTDSEGDYFVNSAQLKDYSLPRQQYRDKCNKQTFDIWFNAYTLNKITLNEISNKFPLVKIKNNILDAK